MKIYVASSWRNAQQLAVVQSLRDHGHEVYDFKGRGSGWNRPGDENSDISPFGWSSIDPSWREWDSSAYIQGLRHPIAAAGFKRDMDALHEADACVMVMPCGPSASMELGYAVGAGKLTIVYIEAIREPDLMVLMATHITRDWTRVIALCGSD
jgi:hypothetical protein